MKIRAMAMMILLGGCAIGFAYQASAQNAVGGPKKQIAVGGAAKQTSPVVPASKGVTTAGGAAKQTSPVVPANKGVATTNSSPSKCPTGSCAVKGAK